MADFVAVLKKTIDGLGDTTPDMRERVYEKARSTVAAKLAAISPAPPEAVSARQKQSLEDAIAEVEAQYALPPAADDAEPADELENVFATLDASNPIEAVPAKTAGSSFEVQPPASTSTEPPAEEAPAASELEDEETPNRPLFHDMDADEEADEDFDEPLKRRRGIGSVIAALILLALLGGGGYAAWLNRDKLADMLGELKMQTSQPAGEAQQPAKPAPDTAKVTPAPAEAPAKAPDALGAPESPPAPAQPEKFTQRLNADGTEIDDGPAPNSRMLGEGTSVAEATQPAEQAPMEPAPTVPSAPADPGAAGSTAAPGTPTVEPAPGTPAAQPPAPAESAAAPAIAVGQKAIFYEERTNAAQGSADTGSIIWSIAQESPGGDLAPEPAIRAEAAIPGKDLRLRMTIRRNADPTLPASHIIELIFLTPDGFEGGGIESILRVSLKDSEQAAGNALLSIPPAKIADGFFLVALNDNKPEMDANLNLLRRQQWIDVPLVYKSGRRALITLEKGIPGEKVFEEAMKAWQANPIGSSG